MSELITSFEEYEIKPDVVKSKEEPIKKEHKSQKRVKKIDWDKVTPGTEFVAIIQGILTFGKIQINEGSFYLCQDQISGFNINKRFGYKYSWLIHAGHNYRYSGVSHIVINKTIDKNLLIGITKKDDGLIEIESLFEIGSVHIETNPTDNCQLASVKNIGTTSLWNLIKKLQIYALVGAYKSNALLDVKRKFVDKVLPKEIDTMVKQNYTNTTGSHMCLIMVETNKVVDYYFNEIFGI